MPNPYHDAKGQFGSGPGVKLAAVKNRAFTGEPVETKNTPTKLETGSLGEQVVMEYFRRQGMPDVRSINVGRNNAPVDVVGDHTAIEVKTGLVSNGKAAQQWRATIGQPGVQEREWLAKASPEDKKAWNAEKAQAIIDRKHAALGELAKELGHGMKAVTVGVILNHDAKTADVHVFDGFHSRIGWTSDLAKKSYIGTFRYG